MTQFDHSVPPGDDGRHPQYKHLVLAEIESHYGSWIMTIAGHEGDALISDDGARSIFGEQYDDEFAYISDEYIEILS